MNYELCVPLHFYNNTAILKAMKRRATGLIMHLTSPKSSFPLQDGKHSRQIDQMSQNNRLVASTNKLSVSLLKRCGVDARSLVEIKRRHAQKRTSVSIFGLQVCKQTCYSVEQPPSLAVLIRRAFSAAARMPLVYIRSDVSAAAETHSQNYTRMYSFDDATTQIPAYFQKVLDTPITGKHNYSVLGTRYSVQSNFFSQQAKQYIYFLTDT